MARSVNSRSNGPGEVSRPKRTKWRRSSVAKQREANRKKAVKLSQKRSSNYR